MSALTNNFENKFIDFIFRAQALGLSNSTASAGTGPSSLYIALYTVMPTSSSLGTEVSGNGYARASVSSSLINWAGTQGSGTTAVSSGTGGLTSNNVSIPFPTPTPASWGTLVGAAVLDAATVGNMLFFSSLTTSKTINANDTVTFPAGSLTFQIQ